MKLKNVALAVSAVAGLSFAGGALALTPAQLAASKAAGTLLEVNISGASAQQITIGLLFQTGSCVAGTAVG